jgi:Carboxypeptidase regulatory-like domain/TonB dependent receptor/TonB-dependent Receptor Plug Domain
MDACCCLLHGFARALRLPGAARLMILVFLCSSFASAQSDSATISGHIGDQSAAAMVAAKVEVTDLQTGLTVSTLTNSDGIYVLGNLRPGSYRLTIEKPGFRTIVVPDLVLNVQDALSRNFSMRVGMVNESVTVTDDRDQQSLSTAVSTVVDQQFVQNMPLNGRSFQSLIQLAPGVIVTPSNASEPGQFSVNGQRNNANYFMIDGVSGTFGISVSLGQTAAGTIPALTAGGGTNSLVSVDAMQEFRIQTSSFAPEYGRMPGSQISIVTKAGTNQWHGTAFDYLRNNYFDARNYFNALPDPQPPLRQNDFGGTVGGPIWKNHTFFFFSYEGLRLLQPEVEDGYFLTLASRANVSPVWAPIVDSLPVPDSNAKLLDPSCDNVMIPCNGEIKAAHSHPSGFNASSLRLDHNFTEKIAVFGRYNHAPSNQGIYNFQEFQNVDVNTDTATAGVTIALGPTMVNDFRANWSQQTASYVSTLNTFHGATVPPETVLYPPGFSPANAQAYFAIGVDGAYQEVRAGPETANTQTQRNFVETFSMVSGSHQLKFGVDYRRMVPSTVGPNGDGLFASGGGPHADGWFALQNGYADDLLSEVSDPITTHMNNWSLFTQDTWKATPRLTLTYGLRWEINTPPVSDTPGKPLYPLWGVFDSHPFGLAPAGTPLWSTQLDAFAPRIGAAFQLSPTTVVRGGFGLFYDLYGVNMAGTVFPYYRGNDVSGYDRNGNAVLPFNFNLPVYQPPPFSTTITPDVRVRAYDPQLRMPVVYEWNAAFERELGKAQSFLVTYVGANGQNLLWRNNVMPPGSGLSGASAGEVLANRNGAYSHFNAMQLQFKRRMSDGLQVLVSYSLAKASDTASTPSAGYLAFNAIGFATLPPLTPSDFDIRNSVSAAVSYELPVPKWGKVGSAVLAGWAVDGVFHASSGPPLDVIMGGPNPIVNIRPDLVPGQPIWVPDAAQPAGKVLNPNAFTLPSDGLSNDALRNTIRSPYGIDQLDLALRKRFNLTDDMKLDFRAEYFNLFNHPMFGGPSGPRTFWGFCSSQPCSGQQFATFGKVVPGNTLNVGLGGGGANGGQSALYAPGGPRSAQFSLRLSF